MDLCILLLIQGKTFKASDVTSLKRVPNLKNVYVS